MNSDIKKIDLDNLGFTPSQELVDMVNDVNQSLVKAEQSKQAALQAAANYQNMQSGNTFDNTNVSFDTNQILNNQDITPIDVATPNSIDISQLSAGAGTIDPTPGAVSNADLLSQFAAGAGAFDSTPGAVTADNLNANPIPQDVAPEIIPVTLDVPTAAGAEIIDPTPGAIPGGTIAIPSTVAQTGIIPNYTNYQYFKNKWNNGTAQKALSQQWMAAGETSDRGIATLNGRYLVAVSPKFGNVGDNIDVCLDDGTIIPATIADAKGGDAKSEWGHTFGKAVDVIEWESNGSKDVINLTGWQGHKVSSITNRGTMV